MQRQQMNVRLHPAVICAIKEHAKAMDVSEAYIIEWMASQCLDDRLQALDFKPGMRVKAEQA